MGQRKRRRFEQDGGSDTSPALFKTAAKRRLKAKDREIREVRWRQKRCSKAKQDLKFCIDDSDSVDRISMLPDELLGCILSRITLKEQIATSILSRRWRYLWTLTTRLDFDGIDSLLKIPKLRRSWNDNRRRDVVLSALEKVKLDFLSRVNHVIASRCEGSTIEDFKVHFDLDNKDGECISEWLRYALACKVQRLELNLNTTLIPPKKRKRYVFPDTFLSHIDEEVGSNPNSIHFKQLKTISLNYVGLDGKALEFFLHNCPLLEDLSVSNSSKLSSLRVAGPLPSLKCLEINRCLIDSLEICDVNLVCFKYGGGEIHFLLRNLPMLAHLSVSKSMYEYMKVNVAQFSSILEQLEIFHVDLEVKFHVDLELSITPFLLPVEMSNLKQLEVVVSCNILYGDASLLWLLDLIQSAPRLQKFVLESERIYAKFPKRKLQRSEAKNLYPHLKEFEFLGFCGVPSDVEFLFHFVDSAPALEKIIVDTKKMHKWLHTHMNSPNYVDLWEDVRDQLEKILALEKPGMKLEFRITQSKRFQDDEMHVSWSRLLQAMRLRW